MHVYNVYQVIISLTGKNSNFDTNGTPYILSRCDPDIRIVLILG